MQGTIKTGHEINEDTYIYNFTVYIAIYFNCIVEIMSRLIVWFSSIILQKKSNNNDNNNDNVFKRIS